MQIYQELIRDSAGRLTTSFMRRVKPVKDNRLRPKGFDPKVFLRDPSPFIQILGEIDGAEERNDPHYSDPKLTGSDEITYAFTLAPAEAGRIAHIQARVQSQSIPPNYLQQRFADAGVGPGAQDQIRRLYYLTSHLNAGAKTRIAGWKVDRSRRSFHKPSGNTRHLASSQSCYIEWIRHPGRDCRGPGCRTAPTSMYSGFRQSMPE